MSHLPIAVCRSFLGAWPYLLKMEADSAGRTANLGYHRRQRSRTRQLADVERGLQTGRPVSVVAICGGW